MIKPNLSLKYVLIFAGIGLLLLLTAINGKRIFTLFTLPNEINQSQPNTHQIKQTRNIPSPQLIASWNLFGIEAPKTIQAPKTKLRLKLIGVISSTIDSQARAIVQDSSSKQKYYKVGDEIKQNVIVKSIYPDHIVIEHNSRDEIIQLKTKKNENSIIKKVVIQ